MFEKAANGDQTTILRYLNAYNAGVAVYNREFQPVYDRVVKTRGLKDWLEPLALQAFNIIVISVGRFAVMLNHDEIPYRKIYIPRQAINYLDNRLIQRLVGNQSSASLHLKR